MELDGRFDRGGPSKIAMLVGVGKLGDKARGVWKEAMKYRLSLKVEAIKLASLVLVGEKVMTRQGTI